MTRSGRTPIYGPEPWRTKRDAVWSAWDLWFCVVAVADHAGDLDALAATIEGGGWSFWNGTVEAKLAPGRSRTPAHRGGHRCCEACRRPDAIESTISEDEFAHESATVDPPVRTREELAYYRIWRDHLDGVRPEQTLGRFATA